MNKELKRLLQLAYSAERAAAFAYQGHAGSVRNEDEKKILREIEEDEWTHRKQISEMMKKFDVPPSKYFETKYYIIGKMVSLSCYFIGWFMPMYFAGRLESGNVNEYIKMKKLLTEEGKLEYLETVEEMAMVEKRHELYLANFIKEHKMLPLFRFIFRWSPKHSFNDYPAELSASLVKEGKT